MKVLFVSSANKTAQYGAPNNISIITYKQGEALKQKEIQLEYFGIKEKGLLGYLKNIKKLRNYSRTLFFCRIYLFIFRTQQKNYCFANGQRPFSETYLQIYYSNIFNILLASHNCKKL